MQSCFQIPLLFESNTAAIPRPTFVIKMFVCHRTCVCRFRVLCRIPSTDWKKPGGLTREKRHDVESVNRRRGSYSNCASYLRRNQLFPGIVIFLGCPLRNLRRGQKRRIPGAYRHDLRGFLDAERRRGEETRARAHGPHRQVHVPWLHEPRQAGASLRVVVSCQRYRVCVFAP